MLDFITFLLVIVILLLTGITEETHSRWWAAITIALFVLTAYLVDLDSRK